MGQAYDVVLADRDRLMMQLKCWASCDDPDVCALVRTTWRELVGLVEQRSGLGPNEISAFFARGVLMTVLVGMETSERPEPWSELLFSGCAMKDQAS